jgi:hypothetical protein
MDDSDHNGEKANNGKDGKNDTRKPIGSLSPPMRGQTAKCKEEKDTSNKNVYGHIR